MGDPSTPTRRTAAEDRLRALAEAATPGPWRQRADTPWGSKVIFNESGEMFLGVSAHTAPPTDGWSPAARERAYELGRAKCADAAYVAAASPEVVLDLLSEIGRLRAAVSSPPADVIERAKEALTATPWLGHIQSMILAQAAARAYPDRFRLLGETLRQGAPDE